MHRHTGMLMSVYVSAIYVANIMQQSCYHMNFVIKQFVLESIIACASLKSVIIVTFMCCCPLISLTHIFIYESLT